MIQIQQITDDPLQNQTIVLPDGTTLAYEMYYRPQQFGWYFNYVNYQNWSVKGMRICCHPNMLNQWRNIIPFGLACYSNQKREPTVIKDFSSGAFGLYILEAADVLVVNQYLSGTSLADL